jgi:Transmembrane secretion effector
MRLSPLIDTRGLDRSRAVYWPEPQLARAPGPDSGPVVVTSTYTVAPENEAPILQAMAHVRLSRLRTGATQWGLFRGGDTAHRIVEIFVVPSWEEGPVSVSRRVVESRYAAGCLATRPLGVPLGSRPRARCGSASTIPKWDSESRLGNLEAANGSARGMGLRRGARSGHRARSRDELMS